jgi:HEPN domain-containing protein
VANKQAHIDYWKESSEESWKSANALLNDGRYMMTLFCWHLTIEKLMKAHWVKDNADNFPPRTHNLVMLLWQTKLTMPIDMQEELAVINYWNEKGATPIIKIKFVWLRPPAMWPTKKSSFQTFAHAY